MGKLKNKTQIKEKQSSDKLLLVGFLALILLHIIGGFWHSYYSWGFSYWSIIPNEFAFLIGGLSVGSIFIVYSLRKKIKLNFIKKFQIENKPISIRILLSLVISIILFYALYTFRSQAHMYGDGYTILSLCSQSGPIDISDQLNLQLLSIYWHQLMYILLSPIQWLNPEKIFALTNVFAGAIGVWSIWSISKILSKNKIQQVFIFATSISSSSIILFFGYIETYTWTTVAGLLSLRFMIGYILKINSIYPLLISLLLSIAFHLISLPYLLVGIFAILLRSKKIRFITEINLRLLTIYILLGAFGFVLLSQMFNITIFVPLLVISHNPYSMFSKEHLSDIINQIMLVTPMVLILIPLSINKKEINKIDVNEIVKVLYLLSLLNFLAACFINPELGAVRDWDLFSFYGIPLSILTAYLITKYFENQTFPNWLIPATIIVVLIHIVPNLYEKNHPQIAVEYLDKVIWDDPHYQADYQDASRGLSWGYLLRKSIKRKDLSEKYFKNRIVLQDTDYNALYNLAIIALETGNLKDAEHYLSKGIELAPNDCRFQSKFSMYEFMRGNLLKAEEYARKSIELDSTHFYGVMSLGIILSAQNKFDEALYYLRKANQENEANLQLKFNLGIVYSKIKRADSAYFYFKEALRLSPEIINPNIYERLIPLSLLMNRKEEAIEYLNKLKSIAPESEFIEILENAINKI